MEVITHFFVFFLGLSLSFILRHGLDRSPDSTENQYFVSATITFNNHKGVQTKRHFAGSFRTETRNPDKTAKEFKNALLKLITEEMPEEVFQLSDSNNYHIQIYSMNRI